MLSGKSWRGFPKDIKAILCEMKIQKKFEKKNPKTDLLSHPMKDPSDFGKVDSSWLCDYSYHSDSDSFDSDGAEDNECHEVTDSVSNLHHLLRAAALGAGGGTVGAALSVLDV